MSEARKDGPASEAARAVCEVRSSDCDRIPVALGRRVFAISMGVVGVALLFAGVAFVSDRERFEHAYLAGFAFVVTIGLGALFFVLLQHLTRAGWSVAPRRHMEWVAAVLPWCVVLFLPVALFSRDLFSWMGPLAGASEIVRKKAAYLNAPFFFVRAGVYFVCWSTMALWFAAQSRAQDERRDPVFTARMQRASAPAMVVFALTTTFAGFDWLMSLQPEWYSTIFGVYVFAGAVTSSLALLALITISFQKAGLLSHVSSVEHRHEIGKLLFGFTIFWAYIAFSQYFLIWYANIPEETAFYRARWAEGWEGVSLALGIAHFVLPFLALLSRAAKRSAVVLGVTSVVALFAHAIDMVWLVMPAWEESHGPAFHLADAGAIFLPVAVLGAVIASKMARGRLFPIGDPRLAEAVQLANP